MREESDWISGISAPGSNRRRHEQPHNYIPYAKIYYRPIEPALRWCNLMAHETEILEVSWHCPATLSTAFPQWPCLFLDHSPSGKPHSVFRSQAAIVDALTARHKNLSGITKRTLDEKFAAAKRSLTYSSKSIKTSSPLKPPSWSWPTGPSSADLGMSPITFGVLWLRPARTKSSST